MFFRGLLVILAHLLSVKAQDAFPTNATIPQQLGTSAELLLNYASPNSNSTGGLDYKLDFALDASLNRRTAPAVVQKTFVNGTLNLVTPFNINTLGNGSIAYINCDPNVYAGQNLQVSDVIQNSVKAITAQNSQGAIILYSIYSLWCNYSQPASFNYTNVFILFGQGYAGNLSDSLSATNVTHLGNIGPIAVTDANGNPIPLGGDSGDNSTNTVQSTTSAMIILYAVTGLITLCFVLVIASGALRARRHPERYGLLNLPVNAHQRRAKGIARAMLETIPIVKFGEKEPMKMPTDVEQGTELPHIVKSLDNENDTPKTASLSSDNASEQERSGSSASNSHRTASNHGDAVGDNEPNDDLACSVCTEDFVKGQDLRVLPCNHRYHPECIDPWLLNVSGTCPLCRIDLRPPEQENEDTTATEAEANSVPTQNTTSPATPQPRFSTFLNRHRMRESTPAQRLRALRALRAHQAALNSHMNTANASTNTLSGSNAASTPPRSNRVSRFFGRSDSNTATTAPTAAETPRQT